MKNLLLIGGLAISVMLPAPVRAQEWWQGAWSFDPAWCAVADRIGSVTPAPIAITATEVLGYENSCAITQATPLDGVGAVHLRLLCQSEGETSAEERLVMRADPEAKAVWIWFAAGEPLRFQRCQ